MKLGQYLSKRGRGAQSELARACGVSHSTIHRLRTSDNVPSAQLARDIELVTGGKVRAKDLLTPKPRGAR